MKNILALLIAPFILFSTGCAAALSETQGEPVQATAVVQPVATATLPLPPPTLATDFAAPTPAPASPIPPVQSTAPANPPAAAPAEGYGYGEAIVENLEVRLLESFPIRVQAVARGSLPDDCTAIDQAQVSRSGNTFQGRLTTRWPLNVMCAQALVPYEYIIPLDVTGLPPGDYTVVINGATAIFTLPAASAAPPPAVEQPPPSRSANQGGISRVQIYLVAVGDNGQSGPKIGCADSLIAVEREITPTIAPLRAALNELLALKGQQSYGQSGLYNALYQSDLQAGDITIYDGHATIYLFGQFTLNGVCDAPRFQAQLEAIALQFSTVDTVSIFINGQALPDALSLSG